MYARGGGGGGGGCRERGGFSFKATNPEIRALPL